MTNPTRRGVYFNLLRNSSSVIYDKNRLLNDKIRPEVTILIIFLRCPELNLPVARGYIPPQTSTDQSTIAFALLQIREIMPYLAIPSFEQKMFPHD